MSRDSAPSTPALRLCRSGNLAHYRGIVEHGGGRNPSTSRCSRVLGQIVLRDVTADPDR